MKQGRSGDRRVMVGRVASAHGIRGEVLVAAFTESDLFFLPGRVLRAKLPQGKEEGLTVLSSRPHKKGFLIVFGGVTDRSRAEALAGADLSVDRSELPEAEPGEHYWVDLIGLSVFSKEGEALGRLTGIIETGANDVLVVEDEESGREILLPALDSVILSVDTEEGRMLVDVPEGL